MSRFTSTLMRSTILRSQNTRWIAVAIVSLFTHAAMAQSHQDLAAAIAGGNEALSEAVFGMHTTAYYQSGSLQIAGEGAALSLDFLSTNFSEINFAEAALNSVNTVVIRFENAEQAAVAIDGAALSALDNLVQVVLLFTYDVDASQASTFALNNLPSGITSYHSISIAE